MKHKPIIYYGLVVLLLAAVFSVNAAVPQLINYQGSLSDAGGSPVADGPYLIKFIIWDDPVAVAGPNEKWNSGFQNVTVTDGLFSYALGSDVTLPDDLFSDTSRWLGITVGVDPEMSPRTKITSEAFAYHALRADSAGTSATLGGQSPSYYLDWSNLTGVPAGFADGTDDIGTGDITAVTAGTGMTGGGSSGSVTLNADTGYLQRRVTGTAPAGNAIKAINSNGTITTEPIPQGDITAISAGTGLSGGGSSGSVTLNLDDIVTSNHTFEGDIMFGDSTMRVTSSGIRIGDLSSPSESYLMQATRNYNTTSLRSGFYSQIDNEATGTMYGFRTIVGYTGDAGGTRYGVYSSVDMLHTSATSQYGVYAIAGSSNKTAGTSYGVRAYGYAGVGSVGYGIYASEVGSGANYAGYFSGDVHVQGTLSKSLGSFKIDHPLDPANKYLQHSFVESPDMMNIYNGNVTLDGNGESVVIMPEYFAALNMDFRYQLTAVGAPGPSLYIAEKIDGNQFRIAGGEPFGEVSWQVTGIRNDRYAQAHRIQVEVDKPAHELGLYLNPEELGQPLERHVNWEQIKEEQKHDEEELAANRTNR